MEIYIKLFEVLFPVFFVVAVGYYIGKKNPKINTDFITDLSAKIGAPAIIFYAITTTGISFDIFLSYFWYSLLAIIQKKGKRVKLITIFKFVQQSRQEASKIVWPTRRETTTTTIMVFVMVAILATFFLITDSIISFLLRIILSFNF